MPEFRYTAREATGRQVAGVLAASSKQDALSSLAALSLFPMRVDLADGANVERGRSNKRVRARYLSVLYTQLGDLLQSGVPLLRSLELLERQSTNKVLRQVMQDVREQVADGTRLAEAMRRHPKVFGELAVSMVRAGEEGGFLEDVLRRIAKFTEHQQELKSRVFGAMIYPVFLLGMGSLIVGAMLVFFVPKFQPIFDRIERQQGHLPMTTSSLMALSDAVQAYWIIFCIAAAAVVLIFSQWVKSDEGRRAFDRFRLWAPGVGKILRTLAIARFCRILGTLLRNGVPIIHSLRIAKDATGNVVLAESIAVAADQITAGKTLAQPLAASGEFPADVVEMISVGEEANNLEDVLIDVADSMERRTNRNLDIFVRMLEPILLSVMAGIILYVVIALMLPILQSSNVV
ncbi:MAG: type II secretion system F family protein [Planctomycetes bacterium]|nr:type II secretion system F family protein [Planctomycetota bacterium]